jgi:catechol 2,3-dioxygenase-like lactoylglutathione lyase family enzyme
MICVPDLAHGLETYRRLGFDVHAGGVHPGAGTENAVAFFEDDYLELLGIRHGEEHLAGAAVVEFIGRGGGLRYVAVQSDDLAGDVAAMRRRGIEVSDPAPGGRRTPLGQELRWKVARLAAANALPIFFIEHLTPLAERRRQVPTPGEHPNGVRCPERVYIAVPDVEKAADTYARVLGLPAPSLEPGTVIKARMAVFPLGPVGLVVAEPTGPGPAAEALAARGAGPFQVLFRARSMDVAATWMQDHGLPPPARGVRSSGEHAMLVTPRDACGVFLAFAGPA